MYCQIYYAYERRLDSNTRCNSSLIVQTLWDITGRVLLVYTTMEFDLYKVKDTDRLTESQKYLSIPVICKYITIFHKIHEDVIELALFTNDLRRALK